MISKEGAAVGAGIVLGLTSMLASPALNQADVNLTASRPPIEQQAGSRYQDFLRASPADLLRNIRPQRAGAQTATTTTYSRSAIFYFASGGAAVAPCLPARSYYFKFFKITPVQSFFIKFFYVSCQPAQTIIVPNGYNANAMPQAVNIVAQPYSADAPVSGEREAEMLFQSLLQGAGITPVARKQPLTYGGAWTSGDVDFGWWPPRGSADMRFRAATIVDPYANPREDAEATKNELLFLQSGKRENVLYGVLRIGPQFSTNGIDVKALFDSLTKPPIEITN